MQLELGWFNCACLADPEVDGSLGGIEFLRYDQLEHPRNWLTFVDRQQK